MMRKCQLCKNRATTQVEILGKPTHLCVGCKMNLIDRQWKKYDSSPGTISPRQRKPL